MSTSYSSSTTYSHVDVEKVMLNVKADLVMIADSTKAMTREKAEDYAHDIEQLAKNNYLVSADVTLLDYFGKELKAITYFFKTGGDASGTSRPGGVRWPETVGGEIRVVLKPTDAYAAEVEKISRMNWKIYWGPTADDTSHSGLSASGNRGYSSRGFGADRSDFT